MVNMDTLVKETSSVKITSLKQGDIIYYYGGFFELLTDATEYSHLSECYGAKVTRIDKRAKHTGESLNEVLDTYDHIQSNELARWFRLSPEISTYSIKLITNTI